MGLATTKTLLAKGASLAVCDINEGALKKALSPGLQEHKDRLLLQTVDISSRTAIRQLLQATKDEFGKIDGIVNIAGTGGHRLGLEHVWEIEDKEFDFMMDVNVRGIFNILAEGLKPGVLEEPGSVVHITSMFSERGFPKGSVFAASKHAAIGLVKSAAFEVGDRFIRVNAVLP